MDYQQPSVIQVAAVIVTGDSIATGIGHNGQRGTHFSDAQWGRSPSSQLLLMNRKGQKYYEGRDIVLSTGILNHEDWKSVEKQFQFLSSSNTRSVTIVGTPFVGYNDKLSALCAKYNFIFLGGYTPGPDGIHPTNYRNIYPVTL